MKSADWTNSARRPAQRAMLVGFAAWSACGGVDAAESPAYQLPDFSGPAYECSWLRAVQLARQPSATGTGYDVVLYAQAGAEHKGNPAGMVGWEAGSTIAFVGDITLLSCPDAGGPAPIRVSGKSLKFRLEADGRLTHIGGSGTVAQGANKTTLRNPVVPTVKKSS